MGNVQNLSDSVESCYTEVVKDNWASANNQIAHDVDVVNKLDYVEDTDELMDNYGCLYLPLDD